MSDSDFALRLASPAELREMVQTLTRERERLRAALEEATRALAVDPRFLSPARLGTARSILAAALAGEGEAPTCTWTQDDEGVWHTACRSSWLYPDGGSPADHRQVYCHACGQRVEAEPHTEGEDEEPAPRSPTRGLRWSRSRRRFFPRGRGRRAARKGEA